MLSRFAILLLVFSGLSTGRADAPESATLKADWVRQESVLAQHAVIRVGFSDTDFEALARGEVLRTLSDTEEGLAAVGVV